MSGSTLAAACAAVGLTLASGLADSYGFVHAARVWDGGRLIPAEMGRSSVGVALGIGWLMITSGTQS
jgi:hypothetical protein